MYSQTNSTKADSIYNTGAVSRMTGIPISSLYAWERRYGFPRSLARTSGGHRLYSEKDVALLRAVKDQISQGLSAHQAVTVVQIMDSEGPISAGHFTGLVQTEKDASTTQTKREQLTEALFQGDLLRADRLLAEMLAFSSLEEITLNIIGPALAELGEAWADGRITVSDEHLASNYLRQRLLMWLVTGPPPRAGDPIVLACAPGEWHEGSLLMLAVLLRRRGWPVVYLGQNVPFADLAAFVEHDQARALVLVGMLEESARQLSTWPQWFNQEIGRPVVTFAGRAFVIQPELKNLVPGIYLGDTVQAGLAKLEEILQTDIHR